MYTLTEFRIIHEYMHRERPTDGHRGKQNNGYRINQSMIIILFWLGHTKHPMIKSITRRDIIYTMSCNLFSWDIQFAINWHYWNQLVLVMLNADLQHERVFAVWIACSCFSWLWNRVVWRNVPPLELSTLMDRLNYLTFISIPKVIFSTLFTWYKLFDDNFRTHFSLKPPREKFSRVPIFLIPVLVCVCDCRMTQDRLPLLKNKVALNVIQKSSENTSWH